eukprot:1741215-Rhodomonas_salina.1
MHAEHCQRTCRHPGGGMATISRHSSNFVDRAPMSCLDPPQRRDSRGHLCPQISPARSLWSEAPTAKTAGRNMGQL